MGKLLTKLLEGDNAGEIIEEWALHVERKASPHIFVNFFLEIMRDPDNHGIRKDAAGFLTFITPRDWSEVKEKIDKFVSKKIRKIFASSAAEMFYDQWKAMVIYQIDAYFEGCGEEEEEQPKRKKAV